MAHHAQTHAPYGRILVEDLEVHCIVGILPAERGRAQPLLISADLLLDFSRTTHSGPNITGGVDYSALADFIRNSVVEAKHQLLETLVLQLGQSIMEKYADIQELSLSVSKPQAVKAARNIRAVMRFSRGGQGHVTA